MAVLVLGTSRFLDNKVPFKTEANARALNATNEVQKLDDGEIINVSNIIEVRCLLEADPSHKDESRHTDKEYIVYMLTSPDGTTLSTSSVTLVDDIKAFLTIDDLKDVLADGGHISVALKKVPSKNRAGSFFFRAELLSATYVNGEIVD